MSKRSSRAVMHGNHWGFIRFITQLTIGISRVTVSGVSSERVIWFVIKLFG